MEKTIIEQEIKYLTEVLGKRLIDSNERSVANGYIQLAKKYWPEEFEGKQSKDVHHIDFNHRNNCVSNLVVLTRKEHMLIHKLFDPGFELWQQHKKHKHKPHKQHKKCNQGTNNPSFGKHWKVVDGHRVYKEQWCSFFFVLSLSESYCDLGYLIGK